MNRFLHRLRYGCDPDDTFGKGPPEEPSKPEYPLGTMRIITTETYPYKFLVEEYVRHKLNPNLFRWYTHQTWVSAPYRHNHNVVKTFDTKSEAESYIDNILAQRKKEEIEKQKVKDFVAANPPRIYP